MKRDTITTLLAAGGLATGLGAGYLLAGNSKDHTATAQTAAAPMSAETRSRNSARGTGNQAHNLSRLIRVMNQRQETGDPAALRELERMSVAELRSMIDELMDSMPKGWSEETEKINKVIEAALSEWYRRDGEEALRQMDALPKGDKRTRLLSRLTLVAAFTDPKIA